MRQTILPLKLFLINQLQKAGIVAVIRGNSKNNSIEMSEACIKGNITAIELTYTSPNAAEAISQLKQKYQKTKNVIIGAGTVLEPFTARTAILAGAQFIVSPSFNKETAKLCNLYQVPYIPGCFTPTEIQTALMYGADVIKVFPGSVAGNTIIKEIHGPFPNVNIMPTGGISLNNMTEWLKSGAFILGIGDSLVGPGRECDYESVTKNAIKYHEEYLNFINENSD